MVVGAEVSKAFRNPDMIRAAMRETPLHEEHLSAGAKMVDFAGWEMPVQFTSIMDEHLAVRGACGIFDVSHMGDLLIRGDGASEAMGRLMTNDVASVPVGRCVYSHILDDGGRILDDTIATHIAPDEFLVVPNAATTRKIADWIRGHSDGTELLNISDDIATIAVQGPAAATVMAELTSANLSDIGSFRGEFVSLDGIDGAERGSGAFFEGRSFQGKEGVPVFLSRTGYTGEDGFEIMCANGAAGPVWRTLASKGARHGLKRVGLGARDTLRLEKGLLLSGTDFDGAQTPLQTGPGWVVKYNHDFIGKEALERQESKGGYDRLVGLGMLGRGIPRHGYDILRDSDVVGKVTSGTMSPVLRRGIALGYVPYDCAEQGTGVRIRVRSDLVEAEIVHTPFIRRGQI